MVTYANTISKVKSSPTQEVQALAKRLKAEGRDIIGLGAFCLGGFLHLLAW